MTFIELSPGEHQAFARATRGVWEQVEPVVGADVMAELRRAWGRD
jgi:hypothetical protein